MLIVSQRAVSDATWKAWGRSFGTKTSWPGVAVVVLRFPGLDGARPVTIARRLDTSKQAINPLLNDLESWGYLERVPDPEDGRGRLLRLTPAGQDLMRTIRRLHADIEREWEDRLGAERFSALRSALRDLAPAGGPGDVVT